ncbi:sacsin N-terminal ATP-binding-like domain-containing protein [Nonomuraea sp. NPDC049400]|uniref:sacsin N-terminal ATP-binding-like domain-containing protein n=1 Tax=Nonomuraea sp. NPDC049400 TaxID=3364352 RepID=UPI00379AC573
MTLDNSGTYGTDRMRAAVLSAWTASPARFREDANAEEDFALGGYRDRLIVELAQNAADAALRAGVPGMLRLTLKGDVLTAANTGAPLDATGVEGLSTLRVSGKRDEIGAAGRFGVGFAAVVSVCDEPSIGSRGSGAVRWSRVETSAAVSEIPALVGELADRSGHVPLLRLPFDAPPLDVPEGFDTLVRLPLRDQACVEAVRRMLDETSPALLLGMPALESIEIDLDGSVRTVAADGWHVVSESGEFTPEEVSRLFADRPTEERARPYWSLRWAVPVTGSGEPGPLPATVPPVVHAPTPSDEPLDLPALLIASFPMATDRRHFAKGPLADFLVERVADAYVRLLRELPRTPKLLDLVPSLMGKGELDARIRRAVLARLPSTPLLPALSAPAPAVQTPSFADAEVYEPDAEWRVEHPAREPEGDGWVVAGREAAVVPSGTGELLAAVADFVPGLLPAGWPARHPAMAALGVRRVELADVVDLLSGEAVEAREPSWWRSLYEVLPADDPESLGALPVPLTDGRLVRGPRGTLILTDGGAELDLTPLGLRIVHPEAAHPALLRLGAAEATPRTILEDPLTKAAVAQSLDSPDPGAVARAVLSLVEASALAPGEAPWLAELALRGADGELYPAGELMLAHGALAGLLESDTHLGVAAAELEEAYGARVLAAAGVLDGFAVVHEADVLLDHDDCDHDLDGEDDWLDHVLDLLPELDVPPLVPEFVAVRDLELVADWAAALELLTRPPLRAALHPLRVAGVEVPSYTAWWLANHPVLGGRKPLELRLPGADPLLQGLYEDAPAGLDETALSMLGVRTTLPELLSSHGGPEELLDLMADDSVEVDRAQLRALWIALAAVDPSRVAPPSRVRAVLEGAIVVAAADDAVVVEAPDLLQLVAGRPLVLAPYDLAESLSELLDLPLAGELTSGEVTSQGQVRSVPAEVLALLPTAPSTYVEHEKLLVDGVECTWRFFDGMVHCTGLDGLARGLAWATGQWNDRLAVAALLRDPASVPLLLAESDLS